MTVGKRYAYAIVVIIIYSDLVMLKHTDSIPVECGGIAAYLDCNLEQVSLGGCVGSILREVEHHDCCFVQTLQTVVVSVEIFGLLNLHERHGVEHDFFVKLGRVEDEYLLIGVAVERVQLQGRDLFFWQNIVACKSQLVSDE